MDIPLKKEGKGERKIEWVREAVYELIEMWESNELLYNPTHPLYKNKHARYDSLYEMKNKLKEKMPYITIDDIKIKMNYLRGQYSREQIKIKNSKKSGVGFEDIYKPQAYWFSKLEFLSAIGIKQKGISNFKISEPSTSISQQHEVLDDSLLTNSVHDESSSSLLSPPLPKKPKKAVVESSLLQQEDKILEKVSSALDNIATAANNEKEIAPDIASFAEHLKVKMSSITDKELQDELQLKIYNIVFEYKCKQRELEIKKQIS